jgi:hypothetical protein
LIKKENVELMGEYGFSGSEIIRSQRDCLRIRLLRLTKLSGKPYREYDYRLTQGANSDIQLRQ